MRKQYSATFKAQVVQQMLREDKTFAQLASEHEVHVNQLRDWRRTALEGLPLCWLVTSSARSEAPRPPHRGSLIPARRDFVSRGFVHGSVHSFQTRMS